MKRYKLILYIPLLFLFFACTQEDELTPSNIRENYFAPDANATDSTSLLEAEFYATENSYVLFNDTLRHDSIGTNANGDIQYFTETIDVSYVTTTASSYQYSYDYLSTIDQKKEAIQFIKDDILPHLSDKLHPYSWLLVNQISEYDISNLPDIYFNDYKSFVVGKRCITIAVENLRGLSESELKEQITPLFTSLLADKVNAQSVETLKTFTQYSASVYGTSMSVSPDNEDQNMEYLKQDGFVEPYYLGPGFAFIGEYPSQAEDISAYIRLILTKTDQEIKEEYANYPLVITKANIMKSIIINLGYIF